MFLRIRSGYRAFSRIKSPVTSRLSQRCISSARETYYVTTPIFYPNAAPHIGHLYTLVTTDIFARHARLTRTNADVHFLTGTDEHGLKIQQAARAQGVEPQAFCDRLSIQFRDLCEKANISHTKFLRTSSPEHRRAVEYLWKTLDSKGLLYKDVYEGWYSISDETFYTANQVIPGPEPNTFVSSETGSAVEWSKEENYKFRLSAFQPFLLEHFSQSGPGAPIVFPPQYHDWLLNTLRDHPLEDLSVSRPRSRLEWGVPVPGDPEHTVYVWFDALMCYLSGVGYPWKTTGQAPELGAAHGWPVNLQVIGKDIIRFHAIYWPAMLKALDLPLPKALLTHAHWTMGQRKMSKSVGNVADPLAAIDSVGIDCVRYYLARVGGRFRDDADWSQSELEKHAQEVMSLLGNFLLRVTSAAIAKRTAGVPEVPLADAASAHPDLASLQAALQELHGRTTTHMDQMEVALAIKEVMDVLDKANLTISNIQPWAKTTSPELAAAFKPLALETLRVCGILLQPFMPDTATKLLDALDAPSAERTWAHATFGGGRVGNASGVKLFEAKTRKE